MVNVGLYAINWDLVTLEITDPLSEQNVWTWQAFICDVMQSL